ncbi:diphthamide biosynthesis protein [Apodospora peruviana]|uniref:Diphthamide biosynthesis protein 3 n=1 Tax=Apodospora peruviana TaxID=516989 RepID=A0AAE0HZ11_9PEZI|nr:diphthamide biosynthesis protein [Apodospora peruviana]
MSADGQEEEEPISVYDEVEIEDMTFDETLQIYHYPCPCGDKFEIALADLRDEQDIAVCPSCSLMIRVIFEVSDLPKVQAEPEVVEEPPVEEAVAQVEVAA